MKKISGIKVLGLVATIGGIGITLLNDWLGDKKTDAKIEEKVLKVLADREKKGE